MNVIQFLQTVFDISNRLLLGLVFIAAKLQKDYWEPNCEDVKIIGKREANYFVPIAWILVFKNLRTVDSITGITKYSINYIGSSVSRSFQKYGICVWSERY